MIFAGFASAPRVRASVKPSDLRKTIKKKEKFMTTDTKPPPFEAPFNQQLLGNAFSEFAADHLSDDLYRLSKHLGTRNPDAQAHGFLGGEFGYGQHFKNAVFEMHPYFWGDCECGFEERSEEWQRQHRHSPDCYQTHLRAEQRKAGLSYVDRNENREIKIFEETVKRSYDEARKVEDQIYDRLLKQFSLPKGGWAVHCTCDHDPAFEKWCSENHHTPECGIVLPNFRHFASGLEVRWYKYIGRGMSCNQEITAEVFKKIADECVTWSAATAA